MQSSSPFTSSSYDCPQEKYVIDEKFQYDDKTNNGRIRIDRSQNGTPFFIQDLIPKNEKTNYFNATQHMLSPSLLSTTYFSAENIEIIQNAIRAAVYKKTNGVHIIDKQDYDQLKIIMRAVFLQYALHKPDHIREQIEQLNSIVLDYCIPKVYNELVAYLKYKEDISSLPTPRENPKDLGEDKTLELKHFF